MNSLKFSCFALLSASPILFVSLAKAEAFMLDDFALSSMTGQAGLTVEIGTFSPTAEFEYLDQGLLNLPGISIGGHGNNGSLERQYYSSQLDNLRVNVSVADNSVGSEDESYSFGFSDWREMAQLYVSHSNKPSAREFNSLANGIDATRDQLLVDERRRYEDGDLIIHLGYLDPWEKDGGFDAHQNGTGLSLSDFETAVYGEVEDIVSRSVDFKYSINEIDVAYGTNLAGAATVASVRNLDTDGKTSGDSADHKSTRIMSNFSIEGYLGPHDLHIKTFDDFNQNSVSEIRETGITWNSYFQVTDLDVYLDLKGMQISDLQIHNDRGDLSGLNLQTQDNSVGNSSFGFAHAVREIYSFEDASIDSENTDEKKKKKGIQFNTRFKGDLDIGHVSFGDTGVSLGAYYITDMYFNSRLKIRHR